MARLKTFSVYDSKVNLFNKPFYLLSQGEALRGWVEIVNDPSTTICKHPGDFTLFELGEYEEETGKHKDHATPVSIGLAVEYKNQPTEPAPLLAKISGAQTEGMKTVEGLSTHNITNKANAQNRAATGRRNRKE